MTPVLFQPVPLDRLDQLDDPAPVVGGDWVWDGLVGRGDLVLLTSIWKTGKTTLLAGLLEALDDGRPFLDRATVPAHTVVVSEEPVRFWRERRKVFGGGRRARLVSRPFPGRPTLADWDAFVAAAEADRAAAPLDLLVVDTVAYFLPGRGENQAATFLDFLHPLRRLAAEGTAVLLLHHPRRRVAGGDAARGSGALLAYVDASLELRRYGRLPTDEHRRRLTVRSRHPGAPAGVLYEWVPGTPEFRVLADGADTRFRENWEGLRRRLAERGVPTTPAELAAEWPEGVAGPTAKEVAGWLRRAWAAKLVVRTGRGKKSDPFRYALPRAVGRDGLPELRPL